MMVNFRWKRFVRLACLFFAGTSYLTVLCWVYGRTPESMWFEKLLVALVVVVVDDLWGD